MLVLLAALWAGGWAAGRGAQRVRVAVVARPASDWRACGVARATLDRLCRVRAVYPANGAQARRRVPVGEGAAKVAEAGKVLEAQFVVIVTPTEGGAAADLVTVASATRSTVTAQAPLHRLPCKLALALARAMGVKPTADERKAMVTPVAATEAAARTLWQGNAAGEPRKQRDLYAKAAALDPQSALIQNRLGAALARLGRRAEALAAFGRAAELRADYAAPHTNRGLVLRQQKQWAEAEAALRRAIELEPKSATPYVALARLLDRVGAAREAVDLLEKAVDVDPSHVAAWMTLADFYFAQYDLKRARASVRRVLALEPKNAAALNLLGLLHMVPHDYDEAEAALRKALAVEPKSPDTLANLGLALYGGGKRKEAVATIQRALTIDPTCAKAHFYLGKINLQERRYGEATESLERAVEHSPGMLAAQQGLREARAGQAKRGGGCGCSPKAKSASRRVAMLTALFPFALLLVPHVVRLARRRRRD